MKFRRINLHRVHIRLWTWLAENPHLYRNQWPEWASNPGGTIPTCIYDCWACEFGRNSRNCPINSKRFCHDGVNCLNGLYNQWLYADRLIKASFAKEIAELPWVGKKVYTFLYQGGYWRLQK